MKAIKLPIVVILISLIVGAIGYFLFMNVFIPNLMGAQ